MEEDGIVGKYVAQVLQLPDDEIELFGDAFVQHMRRAAGAGWCRLEEAAASRLQLGTDLGLRQVDQVLAPGAREAASRTGFGRRCKSHARPCQGSPAMMAGARDVPPSSTLLRSSKSSAPGSSQLTQRSEMTPKRVSFGPVLRVSIRPLPPCVRRWMRAAPGMMAMDGDGQNSPF